MTYDPEDGWGDNPGHEEELFKVPDSVLLKFSRKEVSELKAEVKRLKALVRNNQLESEKRNKFSAEEAAKVKREDMYQNIKNENHNLRKKNQTLRNDKDKLFSEILRLKKLLNK